MREMTATSLKNTMQETINNLKNEEARNISSQISKAKAIAYLVTVASQVIEQERKFFLDNATLHSKKRIITAVQRYRLLCDRDLLDELIKKIDLTLELNR